MIGAGNNSILNYVILVAAVLPVVVLPVGAWIFLRAGRRHDERERAPRR